jgi:hypothetical protein
MFQNFWNYQNLDSENLFSGFDSVEALTSSNNIAPDYIFGLGNKKKKAEKKLAKAEKALEKGNVKKAQRKIDKAIKKGAQVASDKVGDLAQQINAEQTKLDSEVEKKAEFKRASKPKQSIAILPIEPSVLQDSPSIPGSGISQPIDSGGNVSGGGSGGGEMSAAPDPGEPEPKDGGTMPEVVIKNKTTNPLLVAIGIFVLIGIVLYLKRKK